jgi:predicted transposase YbfD/YdcC
MSPRRLTAAFAHLPEPRRARSVTYALLAILALAVAAILSNHLSVLAIAEWGARQAPDLLRTLGFPTGRTPCQSTRQRLFSKLDGHALAAAVGAYFAPAVVPVPAAAEADAAIQGVALDGHAQRGRLPFQQGGCPVHALSAFCHERGVVLAQEPSEPGLGTEKGEAELTVTPALLARVAWPGRVLTGDALFCQRHLCQQVLAAGGEYLLLVKENQPTLYAAICLLFDPPPSLASLPLLDQREARTRARGHGRQDDVRQLVASTDLNGSVEWPGLAQVFRLRRTWQEHGQPKEALHYGITNLRPEAGPPERLLALKRAHWRIENDLHRLKDVSLGEDQSLIHQGHGPTQRSWRCCARRRSVCCTGRASARSVPACATTASIPPPRSPCSSLHSRLTHKPCGREHRPAH